VRLALAASLLLVIGAASALGYYVVHNLHKARSEAAQSTGRTSPSASPSPSPSLGPYGHIASRQADPQPLTLAQLFPQRFAVGSATVIRTTRSIGRNCTADITGSALQEAVNGAGCTQVARATYLETAGKMMGTIGVLNLGTAANATAVVHAADPSNYISPLTATSGPTHSIGQGTGIEEAAAKGHYLILIWAEFTTLKKPANAQQKAGLENFMTQLLHNTANVSLTARMLNGAP
jgi:hypothetical protein